MMESHQDAPLQDLFEILRLEMSLHSFALDDPQPVAGSHPAQHRAPGSIQLHPMDSNRAPMPGARSCAGQMHPRTAGAAAERCHLRESAARGRSQSGRFGW